MVESEADGLSEDVMLGAVVFGHEQMQIAIKTINEMVAAVGKPKWDWKPLGRSAPSSTPPLQPHAQKALSDAYLITEKQARYTKVGEIKAAVHAGALPVATTPKYTADDVDNSLFKLESNIVRQRILNGEPRIDGRDATTVRPITVKVGVLPRTHGSALFTRGETQALVATTLGTGRDAQIIDALEGERREPFMFHYNFPPFSVGETGMMGSPKRREIGHGNLARRGIAADDAGHGEIPVRHPHRLGNSRVERFLVDGLGLRRLAVADGRGRADQGAGGRRRHGPGARRRALQGHHRHPG